MFDEQRYCPIGHSPVTQKMYMYDIYRKYLSNVWLLAWILALDQQMILSLFGWYLFSYLCVAGVMLAVETVVDHLKSMSRPVTTPEEIAQVYFHYNRYPP